MANSQRLSYIFCQTRAESPMVICCTSEEKWAETSAHYDDKASLFQREVWRECQYFILYYISARSRLSETYGVGGAEIVAPENLFSRATAIFASTALLSESRIVLSETVTK